MSDFSPKGMFMNPIDQVSSFILPQDFVVPTKADPRPSHKRVSQKHREVQRCIAETHSAIKRNLEIDNFKLIFSVDSETRKVIVRIFDAETGKVVREIPPDEIVALAKKLEKLKGILFNGSV